VKDYLILRVISKLLIPVIMLFGLYTQMHGDYGPGGGFQAGVIFASAFVLYTLVFDPETAMRVLGWRTLLLLVPIGVLIFALTGVASLILGGNFLEYGVFGHGEHGLAHGNHIGILAIEFGVGITVASVVVTIFYAFAQRR
jgi:multicomponent Na+:H+ antiporter subunit B